MTHFGRRAWAIAAIALLAASAGLLATAPTLMPESYDWVRHTTSESAAQGVDGAWMARLGFLCFGCGAVCLALAASGRWHWSAIAFASAFGVFMVGTAAFSNRPWEPGAPYDDVEDLLHSVTSFGVGMSFAFTVVGVTVRRGPGEPVLRAFDVVAIAASVVLPLSMSAWDDATGVLQRAMFGIAYVWFGMEAVRAFRS